MLMNSPPEIAYGICSPYIGGNLTEAWGGKKAKSGSGYRGRDYRKSSEILYQELHFDADRDLRA